MPRYDHERLKAARLKARLTQAHVAAHVGIAASTYWRYEQGSIIPSVPVLGKIAGALGVPVDELFNRDDPTDAASSAWAEIQACVATNGPLLTREQRAQARLLLRRCA